MTFATLRALHAVIGDALAKMERVYDSESQSEPGLGRVDYPALDVPFYKGAPHTPAEEVAERLAGDPAVVVAANHVVAACGQLAASVHRPFFSLVEVAKGVSACACSRSRTGAKVVLTGWAFWVGRNMSLRVCSSWRRPILSRFCAPPAQTGCTWTTSPGISRD